MHDVERGGLIMAEAARNAENAVYRMAEQVRKMNDVAERIDFDLKQFECRLSIVIADLDEKLAGYAASVQGSAPRGICPICGDPCDDYPNCRHGAPPEAPRET